PAPGSAAERLALAVLTAALLATACADALDPDRPLILDGAFVRDPLFAALVAALRPGRETRVNDDGSGVAQGCALLCRADPRGPVALDLQSVVPAPLPGLADHARAWHELASATASPERKNP
ncbi:hypothetical protein, partial [Oceaniglobus roseus]|uniref:hypothetical protein n=1 Tax=Oceaniglobus roseus TaxID=1737570 RepID=UPI001C12C0DE